MSKWVIIISDSVKRDGNIYSERERERMFRKRSYALTKSVELVQAEGRRFDSRCDFTLT